ncbi:3-methyl-2-oxobutanoate hydroxymethyltransferase [Phycisphaera mikurensis]|uniref:3-methyl-2-oxobutanoate hydroxymethyltransferase n=1 Tax=Phycisphaera mikurensis (strain NBRC 102666 / KCTC 22515 / FYK2301M01) TaxID=1142394 RepID=I0ICC5_PHYMF|nr:3-methyl-2-oxobutanoate hydroxymethyltransferase [Phycisphaera mikurensis]MBB6442210.1 3-methyl-2-oxobutanoate hydroxymethyltransferase [Phycisphaera mikurensis]BAM02913.1 3-methyl-2-oxobutanoate hydroxymethyltransferase [Phycisphaera mikurensis NBRC 102666]
MSPPGSARTTLRDLRHRARDRRPFAMLTCYDATTARWLARGGLDVLLVGDTAGSMVLGFEDTVHAGLGFMLAITAAVRRGAPNAFLMGDMPFLSYQADDAEAVRNAGRFLTEGMADAVKLEVDHRHVDLVAKLDRANIPVVAHIGWGPQRTGRTGVPVVAGRTDARIQEMAKLAAALERAGAAMLLVEQATAEAAAAVVGAVSIPVIGCGAGPSITEDAPGVHGQVVVLHDLLGLTDRQPSFVKPIARGGDALADAARRWVQAVGAGEVLRDGGPYAKREA